MYNSLESLETMMCSQQSNKRDLFLGHQSRHAVALVTVVIINIRCTRAVFGERHESREQQSTDRQFPMDTRRQVVLLQ